MEQVQNLSQDTINLNTDSVPHIHSCCGVLIAIPYCTPLVGTELFGVYCGRLGVLRALAESPVPNTIIYFEKTWRCRNQRRNMSL